MVAPAVVGCKRRLAGTALFCVGLGVRQHVFNQADDQSRIVAMHHVADVASRHEQASGWARSGQARPRARRLGQRSTAYRVRSRLEPSKVRVSSRRSEPGGRVSNARTPSPTTPAPIMKCNSSTRPLASRSFQRR